MKAYISLTCKAGAYNKVLKELLDLNVPRGDIFLLFGPMDILVQFSNFKSLDEFIEKWFNPIRMIGVEEALITKTLTFIVISESPLFAEEPFAFIFLNTQPRNLEKVRRTLLDIPEVLSADTVFGPYDVICSVKVKDRVELERAISNIQLSIPGIEGSMTTIVALIRI
jgi:hypothetical protein